MNGIRADQLKIGDYLAGLGRIVWVEHWPDGTVHVDYVDAATLMEEQLEEHEPDIAWFLQ